MNVILKRLSLPYGYKYIIYRHIKYIVCDDLVLDAVKNAFELCIKSEMPLYKISYIIAQSHGVALNPDTWKNILTNEFYTGYIGLLKHIYQPIISKEDFAAVQEIIKKPIMKKSTSKTSERFKYAGIFSCEECNSSCVAYIQKGITYYQCNKNYKKHKSKCFNEKNIDISFSNLLEPVNYLEPSAINSYLKSIILNATLGPIHGIQYTLIDKTNYTNIDATNRMIEFMSTDLRELQSKHDPFLDVLSVPRTVDELCILWNLSLAEVQGKLLDFTLEDKVIETESGTWKRI